MSALDYKDIHLVSHEVSDIPSRSEIDTTVEFCGATLNVPIIASPMVDVCSLDSAVDVALSGGFVFLHRFNTIEEQKEMYTNVLMNITLAQPWIREAAPGGWDETPPKIHNVGCAVGINGDFKERVNALYMAGCRVFCLDVANSANKNIEVAVLYLQSYADIHIVVGNVMSRTGFAYNDELGVDAIRVGVGGGAGCTTTNATGLYHPAVSLIKSIRKLTTTWELTEIATRYSPMPLLGMQEKKVPPFTAKLIADGGLREPGDICKALAVGADVVMLGSVLAACSNSNAATAMGLDGQIWKKFRGSASKEIQETYRDVRYVEGRECHVKYNKETMGELIQRWRDGLVSCMSYCGARNLTEFKTNVKYVTNS